MNVIVEISARHLHLSQEHLDILFGAGHQLTAKKALSQPGQFACEEKVTVRGPKGELIRIEMFCHGALCMAVSGKCYMSLHEMNASANRGACMQICRHHH